MSDIFSLQNKCVLITGGYGYLGTPIAEGLAERGAEVYVLGRSEEKFDESFGKSKLKEQIRFQRCDVANELEVKEAFSKIKSVAGHLDVLINNAFYSKGQSPEKMTDEQWQFSVDGNLGCVYRCIREAIPYMREQGEGNIINVSSMYGMIAPDFAVYNESPLFLNPPHYGAAKAGVIQLTKYFAAYLGKDRIRVNCVSPGPFPKQIVQQDKTFIEKISEKTCLHRIGRPEELKGAFVFLASEAASYLTGHNLVVDGGWTVKS